MVLYFLQRTIDERTISNKDLLKQLIQIVPGFNLQGGSEFVRLIKELCPIKDTFDVNRGVDDPDDMLCDSAVHEFFKEQLQQQLLRKQFDISHRAELLEHFGDLSLDRNQFHDAMKAFSKALDMVESIPDGRHRDRLVLKQRQTQALCFWFHTKFAEGSRASTIAATETYLLFPVDATQFTYRDCILDVNRRAKIMNNLPTRQDILQFIDAMIEVMYLFSTRYPRCANARDSYNNDNCNEFLSMYKIVLELFTDNGNFKKDSNFILEFQKRRLRMDKLTAVYVGYRSPSDGGPHEPSIPIRYFCKNNWKQQLRAIKSELIEETKTCPFQFNGCKILSDKWNMKIKCLIRNMMNHVLTLIGQPWLTDQFCVLAVGSLGRDEHCFRSDFDYAIVYSIHNQEEMKRLAAYRKELGDLQLVSDPATESRRKQLELWIKEFHPMEIELLKYFHLFSYLFELEIQSLADFEELDVYGHHTEGGLHVDGLFYSSAKKVAIFCLDGDDFETRYNTILTEQKHLTTALFDADLLVGDKTTYKLYMQKVVKRPSLSLLEETPLQAKYEESNHAWVISIKDQISVLSKALSTKRMDVGYERHTVNRICFYFPSSLSLSRRLMLIDCFQWLNSLRMMTQIDYVMDFYREGIDRQMSLNLFQFGGDCIINDDERHRRLRRMYYRELCGLFVVCFDAIHSILWDSGVERPDLVAKYWLGRFQIELKYQELNFNSVIEEINSQLRTMWSLASMASYEDASIFLNHELNHNIFKFDDFTGKSSFTKGISYFDGIYENFLNHYYGGHWDKFSVRLDWMNDLFEVHLEGCLEHQVPFDELLSTEIAHQLRSPLMTSNFIQVRKVVPWGHSSVAAFSDSSGTSNITVGRSRFDSSDSYKLLDLDEVSEVDGKLPPETGSQVSEIMDHQVHEYDRYLIVRVYFKGKSIDVDKEHESLNTMSFASQVVRALTLQPYRDGSDNFIAYNLCSNFLNDQNIDVLDKLDLHKLHLMSKSCRNCNMDFNRHPQEMIRSIILCQKSLMTQALTSCLDSYDKWENVKRYWAHELHLLVDDTRRDDQMIDNDASTSGKYKRMALHRLWKSDINVLITGTLEKFYATCNSMEARRQLQELSVEFGSEVAPGPQSTSTARRLSPVPQVESMISMASHMSRVYCIPPNPSPTVPMMNSHRHPSRVHSVGHPNDAAFHIRDTFFPAEKANDSSIEESNNSESLHAVTPETTTRTTVTVAAVSPTSITATTFGTEPIPRSREFKLMEFVYSFLSSSISDVYNELYLECEDDDISGTKFWSSLMSQYVCRSAPPFLPPFEKYDIDVIQYIDVEWLSPDSEELFGHCIPLRVSNNTHSGDNQRMSSFESITVDSFVYAVNRERDDEALKLLIQPNCSFWEELLSKLALHRGNFIDRLEWVEVPLFLLEDSTKWLQGLEQSITAIEKEILLQRQSTSGFDTQQIIGYCHLRWKKFLSDVIEVLLIPLIRLIQVNTTGTSTSSSSCFADAQWNLKIKAIAFRMMTVYGLLNRSMPPWQSEYHNIFPVDPRQQDIDTVMEYFPESLIKLLVTELDQCSTEFTTLSSVLSGVSCNWSVTNSDGFGYLHLPPLMVCCVARHVVQPNRECDKSTMTFLAHNLVLNSTLQDNKRYFMEVLINLFSLHSARNSEDYPFMYKVLGSVPKDISSRITQDFIKVCVTLKLPSYRSSLCATCLEYARVFALAPLLPADDPLISDIEIEKWLTMVVPFLQQGVYNDAGCNHNVFDAKCRATIRKSQYNSILRKRLESQ